MAELGLVASIFGVASFGTKVATSLYEAADIMIHAHQQIASMAKHVSQFTAVLRHLARVLEAEKGSCSNNLLREIRKIKRSCKSTFKEISATMVSRRFRPFVPVRWLFKRSKAKELEARLGSEQSMLQVMIHTITVSKLGDMQSKSKEDSQQILGLRDEINLLKTLIIENYNKSTELRHAEQCTEVESGLPSLETDMRQGPYPSHNPQEPLSASRTDIPNLDNTKPWDSPSPASSLLEPDHGDVSPVRTPGSARHTKSRDHVDQRHSESSSDDADATDKIQESTVEQMSTYNSSVGFGAYRASTSLLQMVPFRPNVAYSTQWNQLISAGPDGSTRPDTVPGSAMEEATRSVRLLLDKWTTSGSAPVSEILAETENGKPPAQERESNFSHPPDPLRQPSFTNQYFDDEHDTAFDPPPHDGNPEMRAGYRPPNRAWMSPEWPSYMRSYDVWKDSPAHGQVPATYVGYDILNCLRYTRGGIVYTRSNDFQQSHFVDNYESFRLYLVPSFLIPSDESEIQSTEIGKGWVRREALDLLGYSYSETLSGHFSIPRNLALAEIEELVVFSYQAEYRRLAECSRHIVKERGWHERIVALNQEMTNTSLRGYSTFPEPSNYRSTTNAQYSGPGVGVGHSPYQSSRKDQDRAYPEPQIGDLPGELQDANPGTRLNATEGASERKPRVPEVRFTVPRLDPTWQTASLPLSRKSANGLSQRDTQRKGQEQELREAMAKLERLKKNRDEAERTKNYALKSDLEYYVIPDLESRIKKLKLDQESDERDGKDAPAERRGRVPHTVVETDSEASEGPDSNVNDSDTGSAAPNVYE